MAKTQTAGASTKKAAPKTPAKTHVVAAGTVLGPKGAKLVDHKQDVEQEVPVEQRQGERRQAQANATAQFVQSQMATPAVHQPELTEEQKKAAEFQAELAALAQKYGQTLPQVAAPRANAAPKDQRNGITRPAKGTKTGMVWDVADEISAKQHGVPAAVAAVKADTRLAQWNDHTIKTQYARWRQYHGVKGRVQIVQVTSPEGVYPEALPNQSQVAQQPAA